MATAFDPYHRWLSIPPSEQPPNHYRLLGLQEFEANVEVIENAAVRQATHVRPHLRSPLSAYAINLLREIEVARLCLSDIEARRAYDGWLRGRLDGLRSLSRSDGMPEIRAEARIPKSVETDTWPADAPQVPSLTADTRSFDFVDGASPQIRTYRGLRRRKSNPFAFLVFWFSSAAIGLLAGYAVLCMLDPKYDFLHLMFDKSQIEADATERVAPIPERMSGPNELARSKVARNVRREIASDGASSKTASSVEVKRKLIDEAKLVTVDEMRIAPPANGAPTPKSVVDLKLTDVPFDLKKRIIRVVAEPSDLPLDTLRCNVHGSHELAMTPIVDLPLGEKREILFNVGFADSIVGAEIEFLHRNRVVIVEIRPKFRLPSGDEEAFYQIAGVRKAKLLSRQVSAAVDAQGSISKLRLARGNVSREYQAVLPTANGPSTTSGYAAQTAAQYRVAALQRQGADLDRQIQDAESLASNLPQLRTDLSAVQQLGTWGAKIAQTSTLSICIHDGNAALAVDVR